MISCNRPILIAAAVFAIASPAWAEDKSGTRPESKAPATDITRPGTLSDKLSDTGGVIRPSGNVDPHIDKAAPVPHPGSTPVIKPPGTGGKAGPTPK